MKATKCRTCGQEHWGSVCTSFSAPASKQDGGHVARGLTTKRTGQPRAKARASDPAPAPIVTPVVTNSGKGPTTEPERLGRGEVAAKTPAASNPEYKHTRVAIETKFTDAYKEPILVDPVLTEGIALTVRGTPRKRAPKGTFDRKAYQRVKAKERRDADRAKRQKEGK